MTYSLRKRIMIRNDHYAAGSDLYRHNKARVPATFGPAVSAAARARERTSRPVFGTGAKSYRVAASNTSRYPAKARDDRQAEKEDALAHWELCSFGLATERSPEVCRVKAHR